MIDYPDIPSLRKLMNEALYMTLATSNADGVPHITPVFFAEGRHLTFYWLSSPDAQHSQNIEKNNQVSAVIFDSHAEQGTGIALYFNGHARRVVSTEPQPGYENGEVDYALTLLCKKGPNLPPKKELLDHSCPRKLYAVQISKASYNGAELENGIWVDKRQAWPTKSGDHRYYLS